MTDQSILTAAADFPAINLDDVRAAAGRIEGAVVRTPTLKSQTLSELVGAEVWLKFENLQFTAAYKERGALNALLLLSDEAKARGVIAASAGNHAQGLAYHGKRLGVPVTIVMPSTTPQVKVSQTASHGAQIVLFGEKFDDAYAHARELEAERGLTFVHPFDHPHVAAGQGTVALEMLEDVPELDTLIVPIGGGGLLAGMGTAARGIKNDMRLVGVQAELYPSMYAELNGVDMACEGDTLAEGIAVKE
ncbi:MAG: pyridoxal-phosphate dependent enzyme, partial [Sphingopyxis terrae]